MLDQTDTQSMPSKATAPDRRASANGEPTQCLVVAPSFQESVVFSDARLDSIEEHYTLDLKLPELTATPDVKNEFLNNTQLSGALIMIDQPVPNPNQIQFANWVLQEHAQVWFYWPESGRVESVDENRIRSNGWSELLAGSGNGSSPSSNGQGGSESAPQESSCLFVDPSMTSGAIGPIPYSNGHPDEALPLPAFDAYPGILQSLGNDEKLKGVVMVQNGERPSEDHLSMSEQVLEQGYPVWFYWPDINRLVTLKPWRIWKYKMGHACQDYVHNTIREWNGYSREPGVLPEIPQQATGRYLIVGPLLNQASELSLDQAPFIEDFHPLSPDIDLDSLEDIGDLWEEVDRHTDLTGVVLIQPRGWPSRMQMKAVRKFLDRGIKVWFYWPEENSMGYIDENRLKVGWRLWFFCQAFRVFKRWGLWQRVSQEGLFEQAMNLLPSLDPQQEEINRYAERCMMELNILRERAKPVPFAAMPKQPSRRRKIPGCGVYLRTDFWNPIISGGSYGHTCYIARELAKVTEDFVCLMANRFRLLDDFGIKQVALDPPAKEASEPNIIRGTEHYSKILKPTLQYLKPAYIYERYILGNNAGTKLSQDLNIPYILEYNGSEISMKRSFDNNRAYEYEVLYLKGEEVAFKQATLIVVVSEIIKEGLVNRGVDADKILVLPNGADLDEYQPAPRREKDRIRQELGFSEKDRVIGFIGTFGGWHGIDVLSEGIPRVCEQLPDAKFLLIGDGGYKHLVDDVVNKHQLQDRVKSVGMVPQKEGARLLKACDVYVSPHSSHMVDSRFFGSPTKLFEYMAMGSGIVASNLEQMGNVLSPALPLEALQNGTTRLDKPYRAVLCEPGNVDEFVSATVKLSSNPKLCEALGKNARKAIKDHYSWEQLVQHLWKFVRGEPVTLHEIHPAQKNKDAGDASQSVNASSNGNHLPLTLPNLEWFEEVARKRYKEYAPWLPDVLQFNKWSGKKVLEVGWDMGTDLNQFAMRGADVTYVCTKPENLELALGQLSLRELNGHGYLHEIEHLPCDDNSFDLVYTKGFLHHAVHSPQVVAEIYRVLKPGGQVICMTYALNSLRFWRQIVLNEGLRKGLLHNYSPFKVFTFCWDRSGQFNWPICRAYTAENLKTFFQGFQEIEITHANLSPSDVPGLLRLLPHSLVEKLLGWNLVLKAVKPES